MSANDPIADIGLEWQLGGIAANPQAGSIGISSSQPVAVDSTAQLVQAMAGFGGSSGATESLSTAAVPAGDASQQTLLTTPQHA